MGILERFLAQGHEPCAGSCSAWGEDDLGFNDFVVNPHGPGWHLNRQRFEQFLADGVLQREISLLTKTRCRRAQRDGHRYSVQVENATGDHTLEADVLIDAGGMRAVLASKIGARKRVIDRLVAVSAFLELPRGERFSQLTMLEAIDYGWW